MFNLTPEEEKMYTAEFKMFLNCQIQGNVIVFILNSK